jgi:hypothetical protein
VLSLKDKKKNQAGAGNGYKRKTPQQAAGFSREHGFK